MEKRTNSTDNAGLRNRTGKFSGLAFLFTLLLLFVFAFPSYSWAISLQKAQSIALAELKPESEKGPVVLFGLPEPLKSTQSVVEGGSAKSNAVPFIQKGKPLKKKTWLFWEDLAPYARFQHESVLLLVDDKTGSVIKKENLLWYPLVDGEKPAFLKSTTGYEDKTYRVYSNLPDSSSLLSPDSLSAFAAGNALPADAFKDDCLIMIGLKNDPQFAKDFEGMTTFAESVGLQVFTASAGKDAAGKDKPVTGGALISNVNWMAKTKGCKDILIYASGHGYQSGTPSIQSDTPSPRTAYVFTAPQLRSILRAHKDITFKVKLDACYSGKFAPYLDQEDNLLVIETSSSAAEVSYSTLPDGYKDKNGNEIKINRVNPGRGEFTNGNLAGMASFVGSATEISDAQAKGGSLLARMLERAYTLGADSDAARSAGLTHPGLTTNFSGFTLSAAIGYQHFTGSSEVCVTFGAEPPQEGGTYTATISGPCVSGSSEATGTLASLGEGAASFGISCYGTYKVEIVVTGKDGSKQTITKTVVVTAADDTSGVCK
ncbi:MAG: hypothetical protein HZA01_03650 [Nitrospinae bacterium]|nr:hypothetical protein [Nitrospinota bacterium]